VTGPTSHREVELKLRVHALFDLPDLVTLGAASNAEVHETFTMDAVYHDTAELTLFRWGITLRRREGGGDEGWHLKLPVAGADGSTRDEVRMPLSSGPVGSVPPELLELVSPLLRGRRVTAVLTLHTERTPRILSNSSGTPLAELVDDTVSIFHNGRLSSVFREIEVEAINPDDPASLAAVEHTAGLLVTAGAEPTTVSKAASALGPRTQLPPDVPLLPMPTPTDLAVDAIRAVMCLHVRHLLLADIAVRRNLPDSVHQMRVAARRLRSALATFAPLLDHDSAATLKEELKWLASELGAIRDTEVMQERLDAHAGELDDPADTERARAAIDPILTRRLIGARSSALAALRSDRHATLVDDLVSAAIDPPVVDAAFAPCDVALLPLVARTWRRLEKSADELTLEMESVIWHEARIKAKRARYAADAVATIFGRDMQKFASALAQVTEVLGDHQDAFVAQTILREISSHQETDGVTGMALGLLHEYEAEEEILDRVRFSTLWPDVRRIARKAGMD